MFWQSVDGFVPDAANLENHLTRKANPMMPLHRAFPMGPSRRKTTTTTMISSFTSNRRDAAPGRPGLHRKGRNRLRPGIDFMEERTLMSNIPVFENLNVTNGSNPVVQLAPMEQTVVHGSFSGGATHDKVQVQLQAGELFTAGLNVVYPNSSTDLFSSLLVTDPSGNNVGSEWTSPLFGNLATDPITGAPTGDTAVAFRAPTTGTYTVQVGDTSYFGPYSAAPTYNLTLRPIELDTSTLHPNVNPQDAAKLQFGGGGLYAFLNASDSTLTFSGPTGRGFQISGNFSETTTPLSGGTFTTATITGTGTLTLESGLGNIPLPLPAGLELVVHTQANGYNGLFGEVAAAGIQFPYSNIVSDVINPFGSFANDYLLNGVNASLSGLGAAVSTPNISFGLGLGDQVSQIIPNAPVNPAVPYLYLYVNAGTSASFGQVQASIGGSGAIVIDPADPSLYVDVQGVPVVSDIALGVSQNGYIPFTPQTTPTAFSGQTLYGDLYFSGTLDLAAITEEEVPLYVSGGFDINFDSKGTVGWTTAIQQDALDLLTGHPSLQELQDVSLGVNAQVGASLSLAQVVSISLPLIGGTVILDGPASQIDFAASTVNPFENTPLAFLDGSTFGADGYYNWSNNQFDVKLQGSISVAGYQISNDILDVSNYGVYVNGQTTFLGINSDVGGWFNYNGQFDVWGSISTSFNYDFTGGSGFGPAGTVSAYVGFDFDNTGKLEVYGTGSASIDTWAFGVEVNSTTVSASFYNTTSLAGFSFSQLESDLENDLGV